ncbi:MAG: hypothetical protein PHW46_01560 [Candidatus Omnitrophica bacterium]|nr:hypothetical protein [Candidatus Omnitrophota bacterium]
MSLPSMHTAIGMSFPFFVTASIYFKIRKVTSKLLVAATFLMIFCGIWAEVPDLPRFLPQKYQYLEDTITRSKYADIFFFHGFLDTHQTEDRGLREGAVAIFAMFFLILFASAKTIRDNQKKIDAFKDVDRGKEIQGGLAKIHIKYNGITDLHCHILPGIDDGPETIEESVEMCKRMVEMGFKHVVATPHIPWKGSDQIGKIVISFNSLKEQIEREEILLRLSLGADIKIDYDLVEKLKTGGFLTVANSRYFLLEPEDFIVPSGFEDFLARCIKAGFYPIITHPERSSAFQDDFERMKKIAEMDVLIQVTTCSLSGEMGGKVQKAAVRLLEQGIADVLVSDAHSKTFRLERFFEGLLEAENIVGEEKVKKMVHTVPQMVIENANIQDIKSVSRG